MRRMLGNKIKEIQRNKIEREKVRENCKSIKKERKRERGRKKTRNRGECESEKRHKQKIQNPLSFKTILKLNMLLQASFTN